MKANDKRTLVQQFLRGQSVKDLGIFFACSDLTVQDIIREALTGLVDLNTAMGLELRKVREAEPEPTTMGSV